MDHAHPIRDAGQAALVMVMGLVLLLVLGGGVLAATTIQHDPLVQSDIVTHLAYRAMEAGVSDYLSEINANPNIVNCNSGNNSSSGSTQCQASAANIYSSSWTTLNTPSGSVPEYYVIGNPNFTFDSNNNLTAVQVLIVGAAGNPGHFVYQSTVANFAPENGFLTHIWWSNYESSDPALNGGSSSSCTYNWNNSYNGPGSLCSPVYYGPNDTLIGPVYSNDSIYVDANPSFGCVGGSGSGCTTSIPSTVTTADPSCLFVDPLQSSGRNSEGGPPGCANASSNVNLYDTSNSTYGAPFEPIPTSDSALAALAAQDGCLYSGPTEISFYVTPGSPGTPMMNVYSPNTTSQPSGLSCGGGTTNPQVMSQVPVPNGSNGNGVIFVQNVSSSSSCVAGGNPYDDSAESSTGYPNAQITSAYNLTDDIYQGAGGQDCEGDAFVRNANGTEKTGSSGSLGSVTYGLSGTLTVAAANNVVITGNLTYTDCGSSFDSKYDHQCNYNVTSSPPNDALGLIANNYVEVNRPLVPACITKTRSGTCTQYGLPSGGETNLNEEPQCSSTSTTDFAAALCDPLTGTLGSGSLTIDAAILALNHSFAVNNYDNGNNSASGPEGKLVIYGAIAQDWRGAVGTFSGSSISTGYSKYYTWDNRLQYVTIPAYLNPGTPSWSLASSATVSPSLCSSGTPILPAAYSGPGNTYPPTTNTTGTTCPSQP